MAKKFGKFLLFTAAVGTAAAAAYYYMQQKNSLLMESTDADDDYDDFHEDLDESTEFSRNYVPLNASVPASAPTEETAETEVSSSSSDFTPLSGQAADLSGEEGETVEDVEEFFDEEDAEDEEPFEITVPDKLIQDSLVDSGYRTGIERTIPAVHLQQCLRQHHIADTDRRCDRLGKSTDVDHFSPIVRGLQGRNRFAAIPEFTVVIIFDQIAVRLFLRPAQQLRPPADRHHRSGRVLMGGHDIGHPDRFLFQSVRTHSLIIHIHRHNMIGE